MSDHQYNEPQPTLATLLRAPRKPLTIRQRMVLWLTRHVPLEERKAQEKRPYTTIECSVHGCTRRYIPTPNIDDTRCTECRRKAEGLEGPQWGQAPKVKIDRLPSVVKFKKGGR